MAMEFDCDDIAARRSQALVTKTRFVQGGNCITVSIIAAFLTPPSLFRKKIHYILCMHISVHTYIQRNEQHFEMEYESSDVWDFFVHIYHILDSLTRVF